MLSSDVSGDTKADIVFLHRRRGLHLLGTPTGKRKYFFTPSNNCRGLSKEKTEEARGKGLGTSAIDFLKQETIKNGDSRIILTVNKNNMAKKFYESQGFSSYDEAVFDIGNRVVHRLR